MPSMSAAVSALRAAGRKHLSASKFVATQATGSHVFQIGTYAQVRRILAEGEKMRSRPFSVGGHVWRVECYPNGFKGHEGSLSLYLNHASHDRTGDAWAKFRLSILDQAGLMPLCTRSSDEHCQPNGNILMPLCKDELRFSDTTHLSWGWREFIEHEDLHKDKYLKDDCLTVVCDVTVTGLRADDHTAEPAAPVVPASPPFDLHGPIGEVIWNKQKPDVKIKAGGQTFDVHRWMLEGRSPVFKAYLSLAPAAGDGAAELRVDMDADVCKALLQFIYSDKLDLYLLRFMNNELPGTNSLDTAGMAKRLLIAADRYKLDDLKKICEMALLPSIRLSSVAATLALAERHRCPDLRNACIELILSSPGNLKALVETNAFEKMKTDCPSALIDLLMKQTVKQTK